MYLSPAGTADWSKEEIKKKADEGRSYFSLFGKLVYNMNLRPTVVIKKCCCCFREMALNDLLKNKLHLPESEQVVWKRYISLISNQRTVS